ESRFKYVVSEDVTNGITLRNDDLFLSQESQQPLGVAPVALVVGDITAAYFVTRETDLAVSLQRTDLSSFTPPSADGLLTTTVTRIVTAISGNVTAVQLKHTSNDAALKRADQDIRNSEILGRWSVALPLLHSRPSSTELSSPVVLDGVLEALQV